MTVLIFTLSVIAFSDNLFTDVGQESNRDPKFIIHAVFGFAWLLILVIQTNFIRKENYLVHMRLGIAGMIVAIGVTVSTLYIFIAIYESWAATPFNAKANRFFLPSFAILVLLGYLNRTRPAEHKRFMFMATLYMLEPILSRAAEHLYLSPFIFNPVVWNTLFLSMFIYDWITLRRIHPITYLGFIWFYIVWCISIL